MEQISDIAGGDTTKKTMASLGLMCEKDIDEQRHKIDFFIASPFRRSMDSLLERAQATAQSQGNIQNSSISYDPIRKFHSFFGFVFCLSEIRVFF